MTFKLWKTGQSKDKREKKHKCKMSIDSMADAEPPRLPLFGPLATAHTGFCRDRHAPTTSPSSLHAPLFPSLLWIRLEEDRGKRERGGMASSLRVKTKICCLRFEMSRGNEEDHDSDDGP